MHKIVSIALLLITVLNAASVIAVTEEDRAMMASVVNNDIESFSRILKGGYDVNSFVDGESENWLMCDVTQPDRLNFLKLAIAMGGDVNKVRPDVSQSFAAPIMCAIKYKSRQAVHYLISKNADPDIIVCPECETKYQITPMMEALLTVQYRIAYEMLEIAEVGEPELETMRFMLEDVRYFYFEGESQEEYRLLIADFLTNKGYSLNIWTPEKEAAGLWVITSQRDDH